jgi:two-component system, OmpR family, phosphate regulon sensor histidine kinase PhoR
VGESGPAGRRSETLDRTFLGGPLGERAGLDNARATSRRRLVAGIFDQASAPRTPQLAFFLPVLTLELLIAILSPDEIVSAAFLTGLSVVLVATAATLIVPWRRLPDWLTGCIPVLDLVGIGILYQVPNAAAIAGLVVVPAMWLGAAFRFRGVLLATLGSFAAFTLPGVISTNTSIDAWSRAVLVPMVTFVAAASMAVAAEVWSEQRRRLEEQGTLLTQTLDEFRNQRQLNDAIMRSVDVGLLAVGRDGGYESMNPRHQEFLRIAFPEGHRGVAGQSGDVFAADNTTELELDQMPTIRAMRGETFSDYTIWIGRDPATRLAISVSARPMLDDEGSFEGAVLAYHDITDLMRALRVKDDFVASVSHELRTPLTSIMGYLGLATERVDELPEEVGHYLTVAGRNADRLLVIVSDLLTTAQAESTALRLSPAPTDLSALVRQCLADIAPRAEVAGLDVLVNIEKLPFVVADAGRLTQVVDNLLSNALKYTPSGGAISLTLERDEAGAVLVVRDTGIGVGDLDQDDLFTKFFRARNAKERAIPGIGLGLVITKAIIDAHGGTIEFESQEGVGTSVRVNLPFVVTEPLPPTSVRRSAGVRSTTASAVRDPSASAIRDPTGP